MFYFSTSSTLRIRIKRFLLITSWAYFCFISMVYGNQSELGSEKYDLMLVGGGLNTCSSFSLKNCKKKPFGDQHLASILYVFSSESVERFLKSAPISTLPISDQNNIRAKLLNIYSKSGSAKLNRRQLREAFESVGELDWFRQLPDPQYYSLLDSLEVLQKDQNGERKHEKTALMQSRDPASIEIYQRFVGQAKLRMTDNKVKPTVLVLTASSRDPFEVADFYTSVFEEAGANVIWLPLDKTYQQAKALERKGFAGCAKLEELRQRNVSFYRERIYPNRTKYQAQLCQDEAAVTQLIQSAQGLFINGGDQSLTLAALKHSDGSDSIELAMIKSQLKKGKLIVGGTSAGTAVQAGGQFNARPVVMLTNGDPKLAMQRGAFANPPPSQRCLAQSQCGSGLLTGDLTYNAQGGLGLFSLGLLDTHFSERDRESRLAVFAAITQQRFAFGVDEATALLVKLHENGDHGFEVQGANGVFVIDRQVGHYRTTQKSANSQVKREVSGLSHYLAHGAKAQYVTQTDEWQFALPGAKRDTTLRLAPLADGEWRNQIRRHCGSHEVLGWQQFGNQFALKANSDSQFYYHADTKHCHYIAVPFVISTL